MGAFPGLRAFPSFTPKEAAMTTAQTMLNRAAIVVLFALIFISPLLFDLLGG
jgi:hypothetical protein